MDKEEQVKPQWITSVKHYLMATGLMANLFVGNFIVREWNRPGSAVMVGDLGGIVSEKGKK